MRNSRIAFLILAIVLGGCGDSASTESTDETHDRWPCKEIHGGFDWNNIYATCLSTERIANSLERIAKALESGPTAREDGGK